jgi:hypothetical protein
MKKLTLQTQNPTKNKNKNTHTQIKTTTLAAVCSAEFRLWQQSCAQAEISFSLC